MSTLLQLNYVLFQAINSHAGEYPWFDALMIFCANTLIYCYPLLLLLVWGIPLGWRRRPLQPHEAEIVQERRAATLWVGIACLLAFGFNLTIEQFVFEPRPFVSHKVHLLVRHAADASFPSDHTAWSFAVVGMLLLALLPAFTAIGQKTTTGWRRFGFAPLYVPFLLLVMALVIACSIGLARIFVGLHYPGDILGGAVDGLLASCVVTVLRRWLHRPTNMVLRFVQTLHLA